MKKDAGLTEANLSTWPDAKLASEALSLIVDYPNLRYAGVIGQQGQQISNITRQKLITAFRNPKAMVSAILEFARRAIGENMRPLITDADQESAYGQAVTNVAFSDALLDRAVELGAKPYIWEQNARILHAHADAIPEPTPARAWLVDATEVWYRKTISGAAGGQFAAMYGLGILMHTYRDPENVAVAAEVRTLLRTAARNGNAPAMDALKEFVTTPDALNASERKEILVDILDGIRRAPQDTQSIAGALLKAGLLQERESTPERPGKKNATRSFTLELTL
jgi:hypothetical protein